MLRRYQVTTTGMPLATALQTYLDNNLYRIFYPKANDPAEGITNRAINPW